MSVFQLGPIIRNRREELHLSQEDLADGICSVPTLSRIENGERMPTKNHFEMLMQRLGYSAMSLDYFTDKQDFLIHELKFKIRHAYIEKDFELAKQLLNDLEALFLAPSSIDKQFAILYKTLLLQETMSCQERLDVLEDALLLTCPKYKNNCIPRILSYEEIILLNNVAICYDILGQRDRAIYILYAIKEYYEKQMASSEEALRTQLLILYNLSKYLGLSGRYDECIDVCDAGILIAKNTGRTLHFSKTLFNRAWALFQRKALGDISLSKQALTQAYCFSLSMNNKKEMVTFSQFYKEFFQEDLSI